MIFVGRLPMARIRKLSRRTGKLTLYCLKPKCKQSHSMDRKLFIYPHPFNNQHKGSSKLFNLQQQEDKQSSPMQDRF